MKFKRGWRYFTTARFSILFYAGYGYFDTTGIMGI